MNRLAAHLQVPGINEAVGIKFHHLGMHDTSKIAMILQHLVQHRGLVVSETAWRDAIDKAIVFSPGPRIRQYWKREADGVDQDDVIEAVRNVCESSPLEPNDFDFQTR